MSKEARLPGDGVMVAQVLSVSREVFRGKNGEADTPMHRLYLADAHGRVGYVYCRTEYQAGDRIVLGLSERDGRRGRPPSWGFRWRCCWRAAGWC